MRRFLILTLLCHPRPDRLLGGSGNAVRPRDGGPFRIRHRQSQFLQVGHPPGESQRREGQSQVRRLAG